MGDTSRECFVESYFMQMCIDYQNLCCMVLQVLAYLC